MKLGKRKKEKGNRNGFTLIELLVVIAIIGLLASVISANLADSKIKSQNSATIQQVSEYQKAITLYIINNQNRYPDVGDTAMHCVGSGSKQCLWVGNPISTESSGPLTNLATLRIITIYTKFTKLSTLIHTTTYLTSSSIYSFFFHLKHLFLYSNLDKSY